MREVAGEDGARDFEVEMAELIRWSGYSRDRLEQLAKAGVVRRLGRNRYLLRASIRGLLQRARDRQDATPLEEVIAAALSN